MFINGLFVCVNVMLYIIGANTAQQYFFGKQGGKQHFLMKSLKWMFLQFGSIVFDAFCSMFMVWLRPIF